MKTEKLESYIKYLQEKGKIKLHNFPNYVVVKGNVPIVGVQADHLDFTINGKPSKIDGKLVVALSSIRSLKGFPKTVKSLELYDLRSLRSFMYCPEVISGEMTITGLNNLKSFKGISKNVRILTLHYDDIIMDNYDEVERLENSGVCVKAMAYSGDEYIRYLIKRLNK